MILLYQIHLWISAFLYPISNCALVGLCLYGAFNTRLKVPFILLAISSLLSLICQSIFLFLKIHSAFRLEIFPAEVRRAILVLNTIPEYASILTFMAGFILLVLELTKPKAESSGSPALSSNQ